MDNPKFVYNNSHEAFLSALKQGVFDEDPNSEKYVGNYMYMGTEIFEGLPSLDEFKQPDTHDTIRVIHTPSIPDAESGPQYRLGYIDGMDGSDHRSMDEQYLLGYNDALQVLEKMAR